MSQQYTKTTVYSFSGTPDGIEPLFGTLAADSAGNLFGTTYAGGANGYGTVFKVSPTGKEVVLHSFKGGDDGRGPYAGVILDQAGNLYGTTYNGGIKNALCTLGCGVVFKIDRNGTEQILHRFTGGVDGGLPSGTLLRDRNGNLYGTTQVGGNPGSGAVFKLDSSGTERVLYNFSGETDGENPLGGVIRDGLGNLYGTTTYGGTFAYGTVFKLTPAGVKTVLYNFGDGEDGQVPRAGLYRDAVGNLYGSTFFGGANGVGTLFKVDVHGKETVLHDFDFDDGAYPESTLAADQFGNIFGTAIQGGVGGIYGGTVFKLTSTGVYSVIYEFQTGIDGENPAGGLLVRGTGVLFGTTGYGGATESGTVFKLQP